LRTPAGAYLDSAGIVRSSTGVAGDAARKPSRPRRPWRRGAFHGGLAEPAEKAILGVKVLKTTSAG